MVDPLSGLTPAAARRHLPAREGKGGRGDDFSSFYPYPGNFPWKIISPLQNVFPGCIITVALGRTNYMSSIL
jgi:hypothetical protein